jgi:hypothetical protein
LQLSFIQLWMWSSTSIHIELFFGFCFFHPFTSNSKCILITFGKTIQS